jgi:hypothetical protein
MRLDTTDPKTTPKDYRPLVASLKSAHRSYKIDSVGYSKEDTSEAACDTYRIHWENDPIREVWRNAASATPDHTAPLTITKDMLAWLGVVKKMQGVPVRLEQDALRAKAEYPRYGDIAEAKYLQPIPVPTEWSTQYGINPEFLRDALAYVTRGKGGAVTVTTAGPTIAFHNCTRHALLMPIKLREV